MEQARRQYWKLAIPHPLLSIECCRGSSLLGWRAVSHQDRHYQVLVFSAWALCGYVFGYPMLLG